MNFNSGKLKIIIAIIIVNFMKYEKLTTDATHIVNVRNTHKLQTRSLLFPPTAPTRVQFIGGIGIPVEDLKFESVTSGYVLKAEYFLPETAEEFRQKLKPQTIHRKRKHLDTSDVYKYNFNHVASLNHMQNYDFYNGTVNSLNQQTDNNFKTNENNGNFYRWVAYKAIETILDKSYLNGHACLLRSICEHAALPLNYEGGLLAEILHIILTPSASEDELVKPSKHKDYLRAEILGRNGQVCEEIFKKCSKSPMELISIVFEI